MRKLLLFLFGLFLFTTGAFAQSQATTGNIEGRVVDPNGAAVASVTVSAKNQDTGLEKNVNTTVDGNFVLPLLPPGNYTVTTAAGQGFGAATYENVRTSLPKAARTDLRAARLNISATNRLMLAIRI